MVKHTPVVRVRGEPRVPLAEPGEPLLDTFRASDGYRFYYRHYRPEGVPRGRVMVVHGIQSHGGWYVRSNSALAAAGFEVFMLDRRGSGLNTAYRGDAPSFRRLLDDLVEFARAVPTIAASKCSGDPRPALVTISWGAKLGLGLPYRQPDLISRLAWIGPGFFPQIQPPFSQRVQIARARWRNPTVMFPIPLSEPDLFTQTLHWQKFIANDPFSLRYATSRMLVNSAMLDIYIRRAWKHVRVPTLLQLAGADRIINNEQTRRKVQQALPNCTIHDYPGAHHTLEFEPEPLPHLSDLIHWLHTDEPTTSSAPKSVGKG
ncbi:alpha/beta fold hydrolase [Tuwongella immobilis]|uniref:Serine aminopeptidase S33 domain-containing protein n=1 Tax=Tuwongella immobilis TaxID=692036 RepID=A0A6C2YVL5_9BACT|nr:alpha/beta fold hydrolase [Tuwongella immobilis]VIP05484.1 Lysophospholipase OS=Singulisphaera acidiphila (strain ATCC BAA-1392 / DSM 18658 / VKM B-2454 / MOB10) GN=Sinac_6220 PE=4 SV=1: Abhydrolase_6 [Tuwongella immobilis]VTS08324.1 Lysophospholipase OS=Singulisphaera acidiphila (strain ATCC BAA-1392 / DSM 18658 / VKM B-2454 / MOB10) GN=Sinac_6220 PE=4 SV=1: Abhydrolase_6 [Tuwongella immobilis]